MNNQERFTVKKRNLISHACLFLRTTDENYKIICQIAEESKCSKSEVVRQMVQFCVDHMPDAK